MKKRNNQSKLRRDMKRFSKRKANTLAEWFRQPYSKSQHTGGM